MALLAQDHPVEARYFGKEKGQLSQDMQIAISDRSVKFRAADVMHRAQISGGNGITNLIDTVNDKRIGISDFNQDKLEDGQNVVASKIVFGYSEQGSDYAGDEASVKYDNKREGIPAVLLSARFRLKQDGKVLIDIPVERMTTGKDSEKTQGQEDAFVLPYPIMLVAKKVIDMELEFAKGANLDATKKHFVSYRFLGLETASK